MAFLIFMNFKEMIKNLKYLIVFILIVLLLILIVFVSLAASKPVNQVWKKDTSIPINPILSEKCKGLGIKVFSINLPAANLEPSLTINSGEPTTTQRTVSLSIDAPDADIVSMKFANSLSGPWSDLEAYSATKSGWTLASGPGTKTVYVKVYDGAGNYTIKSDTIKLLPDITSISPDPASGSSSSVSNTIMITGASFGSRSSSSYVLFANGVKVSSKDKSKVLAWSDTTIKVKVPSTAVSGAVVITNSAGTSPAYVLTIGELDTIKPGITDFKINNSESLTVTTNVALTISATDNITPQTLLKMRFKNELDTSFSEWEDYKSTKDWTLSEGQGDKTVYIQVRDEAGNIADANDSISYGNPDNPPDNPVDYISDLLDSINNARTENGLGNLDLDSTLCDIAEGRSADMIGRNYFSHTTPDGKNVFDILIDNNVEFSRAAENIAWISPPSSANPDLFFNMWMNSSGHRANILGSDFSQIGIGISSNDNKIIAVLVFLG